MSAVREQPAGAVPSPAALLRVREGERIVRRLRDEFRPLAESEVEAAVDRAFEEIYARGELVNDARRFRGAWIGTARNRCKDAVLAPRHSLRAVDPVEEYADARATPSTDHALEREREEWRMQEFLHALPRDERTLLVALLDARSDERKPRYINKVVGWGDERRKYIHKKLRASFTAFIANRESGELCEQQEKLIDTYVRWAWSADQPPLWLPRPNNHELVGAWLHLQACESCRYRVRAVDGATRELAALIPPVGLTAGAAAAAKSALAGAKLKATVALPFLGGGRGGAAGVGGTSGAAGGMLTGFGSKVVACGIAAACLGGASTLVVTATVPSVANRAHNGPPRPTIARQLHSSESVATTKPPAEHEALPDTARPASGSASSTTKPATHATRRHASGGDAGGTPGDLGVWMTPDHSTPRAESATTRAAPARQRTSSSIAGSQSCTTPGDLGC